jgi:hypothetical protein
MLLYALERYLRKSCTELSGCLFNAVISHEASAVSRLNFEAPVLRKFSLLQPCALYFLASEDGPHFLAALFAV